MFERARCVVVLAALRLCESEIVRGRRALRFARVERENARELCFGIAPATRIERRETKLNGLRVQRRGRRATRNRRRAVGLCDGRSRSQCACDRERNPLRTHEVLPR